VMPGGAPTRVQVTLASGFKPMHRAVHFVVSINLEQRPEPLATYSAVVEGKYLTRTSLQRAVIMPSLKAFTREHAHLKVDLHSRFAVHDRHNKVLDPNAITSTFAPDTAEEPTSTDVAETAVKLTFPAAAIADPAPQFTLDIETATGETIASLETRLRGRWLQKPLLKALIEPALGSEQLSDIGWREVMVDGKLVEPHLRAATFSSTNPGQPAHVLVVLRAAQRPLAPRKPLSTFVLSRTPSVFQIEVRRLGSADGEPALAAMETRPKNKWLAGKTVAKALIEPALAATKPSLANATIETVTIDGKLTDSNLSAASFVKADGSVVNIVVHVSRARACHGSKVLVTRSSGVEAVGYVLSYEPGKGGEPGVYECALGSMDSTEHERAKESMVRLAPDDEPEAV